MRLLLVLFACCLWLSAPANARDRNLDRWFDGELVPYVAAQLTEHPRFKGETVMFVVLEDNVPASVSNALALSLRDRLLDAALNTAGVSIGWRQARTPPGQGTQPIDCTRNDVHYYVGVEISQRIDSTYSVVVRALDLEDRSWVTGFGNDWHGQLSTVQRNAFRQSETDPTFRGARDVPFDAHEADLLAAHLARELSCALLRQTSGSYVVDAHGTPDDSGTLASTVELVGNNLASHDALELTDDGERINATLSGKAHRIDGALFQYWLTLTPTEPGDELSTLSTSAYVLQPGIQFAADNQPAVSPAVRRASVEMPAAGASTIVGSLRVVRSNDSLACNSSPDASLHHAAYSNYRRDCSLLAADLRNDAVLFLLEHQANHGLVRLGDAECRRRTAARLLTRGEPMRWPLPGAVIHGAETYEVHEWLLEPGVDTYYAFAVTDARAARQFANLFDRLPLRCGSTIRPGLENNALHRWLEEFAVLAARHAKHVDWRAIQVKDVL